MFKMIKSLLGDGVEQRDEPFSFQHALEEHVRWRLRFEAAIVTDCADYNPGQVMSGGGTQLALWLQQASATDERLGDLRVACARFGTAAAQVLMLAQNDDVEGARGAIAGADYQLASRHIKRQLVELEKRRLAEAAASPIRTHGTAALHA